VTATLETAGPATQVQVLVNGATVTTVAVAAGVQLVQVRVPITRSSWVSARTPNIVTNPVYVLVGGQPVRASSDDVCYLRGSSSTSRTWSRATGCASSSPEARLSPLPGGRDRAPAALRRERWLGLPLRRPDSASAAWVRATDWRRAFGQRPSGSADAPAGRGHHRDPRGPSTLVSPQAQLAGRIVACRPCAGRVLRDRGSGPPHLEHEADFLAGIRVGCFPLRPPAKRVTTVASSRPVGRATVRASICAFDQPLLRVGRSEARTICPASPPIGADEELAQGDPERGGDLLHRADRRPRPVRSRAAR